ncbi:Nitric oxide-associated protein 1 [Portunus trituberculatus]|uniref:Nitric oxide-associated protein 1 n=1 Tax=Portunus trituberculatus TaxID=210409 RepID=A0A5B7FEA4_PORTR|nr:Nitric oxide-associated protein 1 [Portunus trituberculatus]
MFFILLFFTRFTVFRSSGLPLTICKTVDASSIYCQYLGSPILGVPCGGEERLKSWPPLQPVNLRVQGHRRHESCVDVVLSSAGWVSLTNLKEDQIIELRAWSPTGRGIHLRDPPLLPRAVTLRGRRIVSLSHFIILITTRKVSSLVIKQQVAMTLLMAPSEPLPSANIF